MHAPKGVAHLPIAQALRLPEQTKMFLKFVESFFSCLEEIEIEEKNDFLKLLF